VENEYASHNFIVLAILMPDIIELVETKFRRKKIGIIFETRCNC